MRFFLHLEDRAAGLPAHTPHLAHPHRAQTLQQLVAPGAEQVHETLRAPLGSELTVFGVAVHPVRPQAAAEGDEHREVDGHQVGPADDRLGDVLRGGDASAAEQGHLIPDTAGHEVAVDLAQGIADEPARGLAVLVRVEMDDLGARTHQALDRRGIGLIHPDALPDDDVRSHGRVDVKRALAESCDVYFYHLGARLTIDPIATWSRRLGLGAVTGIDLVGEKSGLIPDRQWSLRRRGTMWFPGETVSVAIGQGPLLATPLQLAVLMAAVANGGHVVRPHLARGMTPPSTREAGVSQPTLAFIREALAAVVNEGGTGGRARIQTIRVAGKTGTAQVINQETHVDSAKLEYERRDHAWFASFAPVENARLVVVVFVEHGGHGSDAAAPLAKLLYERYLGPVSVPRDT